MTLYNTMLSTRKPLEPLDPLLPVRSRVVTSITSVASRIPLPGQSQRSNKYYFDGQIPWPYPVADQPRTTLLIKIPGGRQAMMGARQRHAKRFACTETLNKSPCTRTSFRRIGANLKLET